MTSSSAYYEKLRSAPRCQMRKINGDPCNSPALDGGRFCHFHKVMGPSPIQLDDGGVYLSEHVYLPALKDATSIQSAISEVCELMLHRRIEPKEASALFYAMQVASFNLGPLNGNNSQTTDPDPNPAPSSGETDPSLPPGTIHACAPQRPKRRRGRPRKVVSGVCA